MEQVNGRGVCRGGGVVGVSGRGEKIDDKGEGKGAGENRWSVRWSC